MEPRLYLFGLIPSAFIVFLVFFVAEGITHPLCEYSANEKINNEFIVSHSRSYGVLTYVEKRDNNYVVYVWNKPVLRNRYRLFVRMPKNALDINTVLITDRNKRVLLEVTNGNINQTFVGMNFHLLDSWWVRAFTLLICITGLLYPVYTRLFKLFATLRRPKS